MASTLKRQTTTSGNLEEKSFFQIRIIFGIMLPSSTSLKLVKNLEVNY